MISLFSMTFQKNKDSFLTAGTEGRKIVRPFSVFSTLDRLTYVSYNAVIWLITISSMRMEES